MTAGAAPRAADGDAVGVHFAATALACVYALLVPLHLFVLGGAAGLLMGCLAGLSVVALLVVRALVPRWATGLAGVCAGIALANTLTQIAVSHDLDETTTLMLIVVGMGAALPQRRQAIAGIGVAWLSWGAIATALQPAAGQLLHWSLELLSATVLAAVSFEVRVRHDRTLGRAREQIAASEHRFRSAFADSPVGIGLADEHGHFVAANAALCRLFGRGEADLFGHSSIGFTHPDDVPAHSKTRQLLQESLDGVVRVEKRYVRPSGEVRWAWLTLTQVDGPEGQPWTLAHVQDVTERKQAEDELRDSEANLAAVARVVRRIRTGEDAREGIVAATRELAGASSAVLVERLDDDSPVISASDGIDLAGQPLEPGWTPSTAHVWATGQPLFERAADRSVLWQPVISHGRVTAVLAVAWQERLGHLDERAGRAVALLADETAVALEHDLLLQRYATLAHTDPLTGLPNRRAWDDRLQALLSASARSAAPLAVAMLDLDHFKDFNDRWGHEAGDRLLREVAAGVQRELRGHDLVSRWGGEEFALALPDCSEAEVRTVLARILATMPAGLTCSAGYALWDGVELTAQLLARADAALYTAKAEGRNRVSAAIPRQREREGAPVA